MCIFFAVCVTCTLQVLWAVVHGRVCMLHRCVFTPTYTSATHSLQVVHIYVYVYMCAYACICIWMRMCVYDIAWHVEVLLLRLSICAYVCIRMRMYMYVHVCVYRGMCACMYMYICMSVYMYAHTFIYARVWVYICTCVGAFCLFVLSNLSTTCGVSQVFLNACMRVCGVLEVRFVSACSWLALVTGVGGYVLTGVEIGVLSCIFLYFCGC